MRLVGRVSVGAARPGLAGVVGSIDAGAGASPPRRSRRSGADSTARSPSSALINAVGQSLRQLLPRRAAVGGLEDPAVRALPRAVLPRTLPLLPHRRVDDVRVRGIDVDVLAAGVLVLEQHALEGAAAVGRAKDAALLIRPVRMAERRDEQPVRVPRVDRELGNLLRVAQAEMRPCLAGVGGLVDAVADGEVRARQALAAPDVQDVRIGGRDGDPPDRSGRLVVEDRFPRAAGVGRLPDAAVDHADVEGVRLARMPAAAFVRPARYGPMLRQRISPKRARTHLRRSAAPARTSRRRRGST